MRTGAGSTFHAAVLAGALLTAVLAGCGDEGSKPADRAPTTIRVPQDARTISAAVARAKPGDMVLVGPGVYHETVEVKTPRVTLRGTDRNKVIIDGEVVRPNGVVLTGAGDAVQNLTVRNATLNGILVTGETDRSGEAVGGSGGGYSREDRSKSPPLRGFVVDHVTSYNNGLYGIYAFDTQNGTIENSYTSGMADSGIYVGQCKPCNIAVRGNVAERNAVGYEATNTSGGMHVYGNRFAGNRVGATTSSNHQEGLLPQEGALIAGNVIAANDERRTPEQAAGGFGLGVGIAGGTDNTVSENLIVANPVAGVELTNSDDLAPRNNRIVRNSFAANGVDVVYSAAPAARGAGNCVSDGRRATVRPRSLPRRCPAPAGVQPGVRSPAKRAPKGIAFTDVQAPPRLPSLPGAATARPPSPEKVDVAQITLPTEDLLRDQSSVRW